MIETNVVHVIAESNLLTKKFGTELSYSDRINYICDIIDKKRNGNLILNMVGEGQFSVNLAKTILKKLELKKEEIKLIFMFDVAEEFSDYNVEINYLGLCNGWGFYRKLQNQNIDWNNINLKYYFLSLSNRPSITRALYTKGLLDHFKEKSLISFGNSNDIEIKNILHPYKIPIQIDFDVLPSMSTLHDIPHTTIFENLFNLVYETNPPESTEVRITEKTFKAFAWHQIPIFVANKKIIDKLRNFGFDLFDDILENHSYADNLYMHRLKVLALLKKVTKKYKNLEELQNLRNQLFGRLNFNNKLLEKFVKEDTYDWSNF